MNTNTHRYRDALIRMANLSREHYAEPDMNFQRTAVTYALTTSDRALGDALLADPRLAPTLREELNTAYGIGPVERGATMPAVLLPEEAARRDLPPAAYQAIYSRRQAGADQQLLLNPAVPMELRRKAAKRVAGRSTRRGPDPYTVVAAVATMRGADGEELRRVIAERTNEPTWIVVSLETGAAEPERIRSWLANLPTLLDREPGDTPVRLITELARRLPTGTEEQFLETLQGLIENPRTPPRVGATARQTRDGLHRRTRPQDETQETLRGNRAVSRMELMRIFEEALGAASGNARRQVIAAASTNPLLSPETLVRALSTTDLLDAPQELIGRLEEEGRLELLDWFLDAFDRVTPWRALPGFLEHIRDQEAFLIGIFERRHHHGTELPDWTWRHPVRGRRPELFLAHAPYPQIMRMAKDDPELLTQLGQELLTELDGDGDAVEAIVSIETEFTGTFRELLEAAKRL